jgi:hypothetical protein
MVKKMRFLGGTGTGTGTGVPVFFCLLAGAFFLPFITLI